MQTFEEFMNEGRKIDHKDIPAENQGGDCYAVGYQYFMKNYAKNPNLRLCHGLVTGQGAIKGIKYNHCWCEDTKSGNVIDMTMPEFFQNVAIEVYYYMGKSIKTMSSNMTRIRLPLKLLSLVHTDHGRISY